MNPPRDRLLVVGGSGYLGRELVRQAMSLGLQVSATHFSGDAGKDGATWIPIDVRDEDAVRRAVERVQPMRIVNTAFIQTERDMWATTANGAAAVARAAASLEARLVHFSTDMVFDGRSTAAYLETDPPSPVSAYGEAKAESERVVAAAFPEVAIVRTSLIYEGGTPPSNHEQFVLDAVDGRTDARFFTDEIRCPITVGDLAAATLELAGLAASGTFHLAGAEAVSRYELARLVAAFHGRSPGAVRSARSELVAPARPRNLALNVRATQARLGTRLRGVGEVLATAEAPGAAAVAVQDSRK